MFLKDFSLIFKYFHQSYFFSTLRKTAHKVPISKKTAAESFKIVVERDFTASSC